MFIAISQRRLKEPLQHHIFYPIMKRKCQVHPNSIYTWGRVWDQSAFILLDLGSTHNFISVELTQKLGINGEDMGPPLQALGAFEGQQVPVTPLIGKLRLHIQNYSDSEDFFISPLVHQDVILGMPWFHRLYAKLQFP